MPLPYNPAQEELAPLIHFANDGGIAMIRVGVEQREYYVHKALLVFHSEFFAEVFEEEEEGAEEEETAEEKTVWLKHVEPIEFNIFQNWIYTQHLPAHTDWYIWARIVQVWDVSGVGEYEVGEALVKAYVLAERLRAYKFRREVNNAAVGYEITADILRDDLLPTAVRFIEFAYANITADRPILHYLVANYCENHSEHHNEHEYETNDEMCDLERFPRRFVEDVALEYWAKRERARTDGGKTDTVGKICYKEHAPVRDSCSDLHPYCNSLSNMSDEASA